MNEVEPSRELKLAPHLNTSRTKLNINREGRWVGGKDTGLLLLPLAL